MNQTNYEANKCSEILIKTVELRVGVKQLQVTLRQQELTKTSGEYISGRTSLMVSKCAHQSNDVAPITVSGGRRQRADGWEETEERSDSRTLSRATGRGRKTRTDRKLQGCSSRKLQIETPLDWFLWSNWFQRLRSATPNPQLAAVSVSLLVNPVN